MAFKLTYYYGRMGCLGPYQVVGHPDSDLASQWQGPGVEETFGLSGQQGGKSPGRRRKAQKHVGMANRGGCVVLHAHERSCLGTCLLV